MKDYYVYIIASQKNGTIYTGVSNNIVRRIYEHKNKLMDGFSKKYNLCKLVYYEIYADPENAIKREKQIKKWNRAWKLELIEKDNPDWNDLYNSLF